MILRPIDPATLAETFADDPPAKHVPGGIKEFAVFIIMGALCFLAPFIFAGA